MPRLRIRSNKRTGGRKPTGVRLQVVADLTTAMSCACVSQEPPSKLQRNAEAYCREQGFRPGTNDFEGCVEKTKEEIVGRARGSYQRLIRGEGR